ncbi:FecR family protein [Sphingobacterium psychroaquaticum]|uniref:FecR family protein n=1 Tax=Sphingobacterium psychroaquaticum TaxID=561061 RepID=UPI001069AF48|nr:FecR family protein [Sphingobacterium psychroaquaticum]QBQ41580.1 FecR family protein [Sphingobacterium psychroaquaticum]
MNAEIVTLFQKYIDQTCTAQELEQVYAILKDGAHTLEWQLVLDQEADALLASGVESNLSTEEVDSLYAGIVARMQPARTVRRLWPRIAVAAAAAILVVSGFYYFNTSNDAAVEESLAQRTNMILPGKVGATLTLANGKQIRLDDMQDGELANEAGVVISKSADGRLVYEIKGGSAAVNRINTLSTANGETYQVRLPDGSMVYLNAASSITYTTALVEDGKRRVQLTGEGYFEVAKDKTHPFVVKIAGQEVEVLGTHFNVSGYADEGAVKTTLLEGKVKVYSETLNKTVLLEPGKQAVVSNQAMQVRSGVDLEEVIAWRNGYFKFNGNIEEIMANIGRWYNVEVVYQQKPDANLAFGAEISRDKDLSTVLRMIELTGDLRFKVEGRRVIVMP